MTEPTLPADYERQRAALEFLAFHPARYGGASVVARWGLGDDTVTFDGRDELAAHSDGCSEGGLADA